jgi:hypothetical protein
LFPVLLVSISLLKDAFPVIKIIPVTETEIKSIIHSLTSEELPVSDEITEKKFESL